VYLAHKHVVYLCVPICVLYISPRFCLIAEVLHEYSEESLHHTPLHIPHDVQSVLASLAPKTPIVILATISEVLRPRLLGRGGEWLDYVCP
jgi:hypothetical protein